jgi:transcriptional regulator with XRE-family HTH domain
MHLGQYLRDAREQRNLTLRAIAACTKLRPQLLAALEANDLSAWPKPLVYRRAWVRAYARAVGLDPEHVLNVFDEALADRTAADEVPLVRERPGARPWFRDIALAAAGLLCAGAFFWRAAQPGDRPAQHHAATRTAAGNKRAEVGSSGRMGESGAVAPTITTAGQAVPSLDDEDDADGSLTIITDPPGAWVTVDGIGRGAAPVTVRFLSIGSHRIRVVNAGSRTEDRQTVLTPAQPARLVRIPLLPP